MGALTPADALELGIQWQESGGSAIVHIVRDERGACDAATKLVVGGDGRVAGQFPREIHASAVAAAQQTLITGKSRLFSLKPTPEGGVNMGMQDGDVDIFVEILSARLALIIVGAGHIAQPLAVIGNVLGFSVTVIDDRAQFANRQRFPTADAILAQDFVEGLRSLEVNRRSFVVLVTRGHVHDAACLRYALTTKAAYIGMIGSKTRIRTVLDALTREGFKPELLDRVYGPVGIDIGSQTPAEIAVAIAAEIVDVHRGGRAPHLRRGHRAG